MTTAQTIRRRDRWSDAAVISLAATALILGLILRHVTLFRTVAFSIAQADVAGRCPAAWVREIGDDPLLRVRDARGGEFDTLLELRRRPLAAQAELTMALDTLALERASQVTAYRILHTDQALVGERTATRRAFTYVYEGSNPYLDRLPVVVLGVDLALRDEDSVIVATLLASTETFDSYYRPFYAFAESLEF